MLRSLFLLALTGLLLVCPPARAEEPVPVWIFDAKNFEFWRKPQGEWQGLYSELIKTINKQGGTKLQLRPLSGADISQRFAQNEYGVYAGVLRTE